MIYMAIKKSRLNHSFLLDVQRNDWKGQDPREARSLGM